MVGAVDITPVTAAVVAGLQAGLTAVDGSYAGVVGDGAPPTGRDDYVTLYEIVETPVAVGMRGGLGAETVTYQAKVRGRTKEQRDYLSDLVKAIMCDPSTGFDGASHQVTGDRRMTVTHTDSDSSEWVRDLRFQLTAVPS